MPSQETEDQLSLRSVVPNSRGSGIYPHLGAHPAHCEVAVRDSKGDLVPQQRGHSLELLARGRIRGQSLVGHAVQIRNVTSKPLYPQVKQEHWELRCELELSQFIL